MPFLRVAVGVIKNPSGQVLISLRDNKLHQGGLWEFPGGKVELGETVQQALTRELKEELDIAVETVTPLITVNYQYPDLAVQLQTFLVESFKGKPKGCQGQPIRWVNPDDLSRYEFPLANLPIISAVRLPPYYAILDDADFPMLLLNLQKILDKGVKLVQARLKRLSAETLLTFLDQALLLCRRHNAKLLLNSGVVQIEHCAVDGIHLTSRDLLCVSSRPKGFEWVAASCHNLAELRHAEVIGVDFAVLAPVLPTLTHPEAHGLGWEKFAELIAEVNMPVYALGGLASIDLLTARQNGAQGIAGIRAFL